MAQLGKLSNGTGATQQKIVFDDKTFDEFLAAPQQLYVTVRSSWSGEKFVLLSGVTLTLYRSFFFQQKPTFALAFLPGVGFN